MADHPREYSPSDFLYGPMIGEGRFGSIVYAEQSVGDDDKRQGYAIKMIPKSEILRYNLLEAVMTEKRILSEVLGNNQNEEETSSSSTTPSAADMIPKLFCCFHDDSYLYFVLELCHGGTMLDLFEHCDKRRQIKINDDIIDTPFMDKAWIRYYAGQLVRVLEYIHQKGVIHRDISPQNILLTSRGLLKLCDFGSAVIIETSLSEHSASKRIKGDGDNFFGTADFVCPEAIRGKIESNNTDPSSMIQQNELLPAIDLWSFGCLIFNMCVGESPFHAESDQIAFQRILDYANEKSCIKFPSYVDLDVKDLILSLLMIDATKRIGVSDSVVSCNKKSLKKQYHSLRKHKFFSNEANLQQQFWTLLENNSLEAPHEPAEQSWVSQLQQSGRKMKRIDEIHFEL